VPHTCVNASCVNASCVNASCVNASCVNASCVGYNGNRVPSEEAAMAIAAACPECAHSVPVTADMAGRRARCPQCRKELNLPTTLIDLPDRGDGLDRTAAPPMERWSVWPWVFGIVGTVAALCILCGGPAAIIYYLLRGDRESAELAAAVKVGVPGANLPPGAPPRAMRVTEFAGVFQVKGHLVRDDVVFKNQGGGGANNNRVCKEYVVDLEAGRNYVINLDAPQFDAYLRLANLNGPVIAEDDDSGGGLNSQIQFTAPETKSYLVVATSLSGGFGPFTLTVRESRYRKPR
jgi:hypothetical protein